jgi:hypothetical protein
MGREGFNQHPFYTFAFMDWTVEEVDLIIADYFSMLVDELTARPYNKTTHRRQIKPFLHNRPDGSIERKHQNISAILIGLGVPYINGYKPLGNYQALLKERVVDYLRNKPSLEPTFEKFTENVITPPPQNISFEKWLDTPPTSSNDNQRAEDPSSPYRTPVKTNYIEREQRNSALGMAGEELVLEYERWRLPDKYAHQVRWISKEEGDGAGFDILSKNDNGTDRYIEVKTTKLGKDTPIFFSRNEYEFSQEKSEHFMLYRVFNFREAPRLFTAKGNYDKFCVKEPTQFIGKI